MDENGKGSKHSNGYYKLLNGTSSSNGNGINNGISENGKNYLRNRQTAVK